MQYWLKKRESALVKFFRDIIIRKRASESVSNFQTKIIHVISDNSN